MLQNPQAPRRGNRLVPREKAALHLFAELERDSRFGLCAHGRTLDNDEAATQPLDEVGGHACLDLREVGICAGRVSRHLLNH